MAGFDASASGLYIILVTPFTDGSLDLASTASGFARAGRFTPQ